MVRLKTIATILLAATASLPVSSQAPGQNPNILPERRAKMPAHGTGYILQMDPALDQLIPPGTQVEKVLGREEGFSEGPVWGPEGALLFCDRDNQVIWRLTSTGELVNAAKVPQGCLGLAIDRESRMVVTHSGLRQVSRIEKDGSLTVLASRYQDKPFNGPNDLAIKSDGSIYFTDPLSGKPRDLGFNGIYRIVGSRVDLLNKEITQPNGIAFSPDEKYLYIGNAPDPKHRHWYRLEVKSDGTLGSAQVFFDATDAEGEGNPDGLKTDAAGNIWGAGPGAVWIISPQGKLLGRIETTPRPANVAWGGPDGSTLYIASRTHVFRVQTKSKWGRKPFAK